MENGIKTEPMAMKPGTSMGGLKFLERKDKAKVHDNGQREKFEKHPRPGATSVDFQ